MALLSTIVLRPVLILLVCTLLLSFTSCKDTQAHADIPHESPFNSVNKNRSAWQKPSLVIEHLGDVADKTVVDIGAGTGYFAFRLAYAARKVIAVEIDQDLIDLMDGIKINLPAEMQAHFETRLGTTDNPNLKPEEADIALIINTITFINQPQRYLERLRKGLAPDGRLTILDYKKDYPIPLADVPVSEDRLSYREVSSLLESSGFTVDAIDTTTLSYQYMVTAIK